MLIHWQNHFCFDIIFRGSYTYIYIMQETPWGLIFIKLKLHEETPWGLILIVKHGSGSIAKFNGTKCGL